MSKIYIPTNSPDDWKPLLAEPEKQWKRGYSARALAHCWEEASGLPKELDLALRQSDDQRFQNIELLLAIPEHKTPLPGGSRPSQTDLFVLARNDHHLITIAIEGKVSEPFGPTVTQWLKDASRGKRKRLAFLCETLGLGLDQVSSVRYQLLHRTASAVLEARRFNAAASMIIVHSFSQESQWFEDYAHFLKQFSLEGQINRIDFAQHLAGIDLYLGWVKGSAKYLEA